MNNALLADLEEKVDHHKDDLQIKHTELVNLIAIIERIAESNDWQALKRLLFDSLVGALERRIMVETTKSVIDTTELYRLNGQLTWAKRYADLSKLAGVYRVELANIKKQLKTKA